MKVFLDDSRDSYSGWYLVKSAKEAIALIETGQVSEISLDHDLASTTKGKSGYDVACWIEKKVFTDEGFDPPKVSCHSMNSVGKKKIQIVIKRIEQHLAERKIEDES